MYTYSFAQDKKEEKKDDKKKDKKKKGEPDVELISLPPEITNLATFKMKLEDLIEGAFDLEETFTQDLVSFDAHGEDKNESFESGSQHLKVKIIPFSPASHEKY